MRFLRQLTGRAGGGLDVADHICELIRRGALAKRAGNALIEISSFGLDNAVNNSGVHGFLPLKDGAKAQLGCDLPCAVTLGTSGVGVGIVADRRLPLVAMRRAGGKNWATRGRYVR
jgi:hypothetical protein